MGKSQPKQIHSSTATATVGKSKPKQTHSSTTTSSPKLPFPSRKIRKPIKKPTTTTITIPKTILPLPIPIPILKPLTTSAEITAAIAHLTASDPLLVPIISSSPPPAFGSKSPLPPFQSLTRTILYQQLATPAASKIYARFLALFQNPNYTPPNILSLPAAELRNIGVSARKASYIRDLAEKFHDGTLDDCSVAAMDNEVLLSELTKVKGIGEWSVHMFMMFSLHRPDVLPVGDLGVRKGVKLLYGLGSLPEKEEMVGLCDKWRPYRSVGAWYMWRLMESQKMSQKSEKKKNVAVASAVAAEDAD